MDALLRKMNQIQCANQVWARVSVFFLRFLRRMVSTSGQHFHRWSRNFRIWLWFLIEYPIKSLNPLIAIFMKYLHKITYNRVMNYLSISITRCVLDPPGVCDRRVPFLEGPQLSFNAIKQFTRRNSWLLGVRRKEALSAPWEEEYVATMLTDHGMIRIEML